MPSFGLKVAAGAIGSVALLLAILGGLRAGTDTAGAQAIGNVIGTLIVVGIVAVPFYVFGSPKAAVIAAIVCMSLYSCSQIGGVALQTEQDRELQQAFDSLGIEPGNGPDITRSETRCIEAQGVNEESVLNALTDTSIVGAQEQVELFDAVLQCVPGITEEAEWIEQFRRGISHGLGLEIGAAEASCLLEYVLENAESPGAALAGEDLLILTESMEICLDADVQAELRGDAGTGPQNYGDDPDKDRLLDRCRTGNNMACDLLYDTSSITSEYWQVASDCAGRDLANETSCVAGMVDGNLDGFIDDDSPGWTGVASACTDGDMIACDFTFWFSRVGSTNERIGSTCGDRVAFGADGMCVATYGETAAD